MCVRKKNFHVSCTWYKSLVLWLPLIWLIFTHLNLDSTNSSTICRCSAIPGFIRHGIWVWIGHWIGHWHSQNGTKTRQEGNCKGLFVEWLEWRRVRQNVTSAIHELLITWFHENRLRFFLLIFLCKYRFLSKESDWST